MWSRKTRNLGVRRSTTTLFAQAFLFAGLCASAAQGQVANEDRALRQALTIIQLLRAEFSRLASSTETPAPTCAPTTADQPSQSEPSRRYWTRYKRPVPQRRMDYEDGFGAHPSPDDTTTLPPTTTSEPLTSSPQKDNAATPESVVPNPVTQPTTPPSTSTLPSSTLSSAKSDTVSSTLVTSDPNFQSTTKIVSPSESTSIHLPSFADSSLITTPVTVLQSPVKKISIDAVVTEITVYPVNSKLSAVIKPATTPKPGGSATNDITDTPSPELQQVAMELAGELEASGVDQPRNFKLKDKLKQQTTTLRQTVRATWREYLPHSTRYSVPLPENHAFCYTDPNNPLCRTII